MYNRNGNKSLLYRIKNLWKVFPSRGLGKVTTGWAGKREKIGKSGMGLGNVKAGLGGIRYYKLTWV